MSTWTCLSTNWSVALEPATNCVWVQMENSFGSEPAIPYKGAQINMRWLLNSSTTKTLWASEKWNSFVYCNLIRIASDQCFLDFGEGFRGFLISLLFMQFYSLKSFRFGLSTSQVKFLWTSNWRILGIFIHVDIPTFEIEQSISSGTWTHHCDEAQSETLWLLHVWFYVKQRHTRKLSISLRSERFLCQIPRNQPKNQSC